MKYDLIFYTAKKTGYCEKKLTALLKTIGGEVNRISPALTPSALGDEVMRGLRACRLTVIIGGLSAQGDENLATVLSRVLSNSGLTLDNMRRLTAESGDTGYIILYKTQAILALPDDPGLIEELLGEKVRQFLKEKLDG